MLSLVPCAVPPLAHPQNDAVFKMLLWHSSPPMCCHVPVYSSSLNVALKSKIPSSLSPQATIRLSCCFGRGNHLQMSQKAHYPTVIALPALCVVSKDRQQSSVLAVFLTYLYSYLKYFQPIAQTLFKLHVFHGIRLCPPPLPAPRIRL